MALGSHPGPTLAKPKALKSKRETTTLAPKSIAETIRNFRFVADFSTKEPERDLSSDELFWQYPLELPKVEFPVFPDFTNLEEELPKTEGEGRAVQHYNRARMAYLEGNYESARKSLLSAKARYGKDHAFHRRTDYLLGYVYMKLAAEQMMTARETYEDAPVKGKFSNAATFLSWAFNMKKDVPDPVVNKASPKGLYNLAAIYFRYDRYAASFAAAELGLDFLRVSGRSDFRMPFRRITAENYIKNGTFLEAIQELDQALRQDYNNEDAAAIMHRAGDIYFRLNNYELAEEAYEIGAKADEKLRQISPAQLLLRAESLFWLKRFKEAKMYIHNGLAGISFRAKKNPPSPATASWAALRFADIHLAEKDLPKAKLAYFKVDREHRGSIAAKVAKVRLACLELPQFKGNNVGHARTDLEKLRTDPDLPPQARELAWACHTASFAARERTPAMIEKVRSFAKAYPESKFLRELVEPVRETQAKLIDDYFKSGDDYGAVAFFEKNRQRLFAKKIPTSLSDQLFKSYANIGKPKKAMRYYRRGTAKSDIDLLRVATVLSETRNTKELRRLAPGLTKRKWQISRTELASQFAIRVTEAAQDAINLPWLLPLYEHWTSTNNLTFCDTMLPLLVKAGALPAKTRKKTDVSARTLKAIGTNMPGLLESSPACATTLLDLEFNLESRNPNQLAKKYLARESWPASPDMIAHAWALSENIANKGNGQVPDNAKSLWQMIIKKGDPNSNEVTFAKARLDPNATEFEKIWQ